MTSQRLVTWTALAVLTALMASYVSTSDYHQVPPPEFLPGNTNITRREGDIARLSCSVRNLGTKEVVWRHLESDNILTIGKMIYAPDPNIILDSSTKAREISQWDLVISPLRKNYTGTYECQIISTEKLYKLVRLNVVGPPITLPESRQYQRGRGVASNRTVSVCGGLHGHQCHGRPHFSTPINGYRSKPMISVTGRNYVNLGETIRLVCNASGGHRVPDEIDWFKSGDRIDNVKQEYRHIIIDKYRSPVYRAFISELIIDHSQLNDTGDYICRSSRNDIANLKVTVLHAERNNNRRGTGETSQGHSGGHARGADTFTSGAQRNNFTFLITCVALVMTFHHIGHGLLNVLDCFTSKQKQVTS